MVKKKEKAKDEPEVTVIHRSRRYAALVLPAIYLLALGIFCLEYQIIPGPELLVLGILVYVGYSRRTWRVVRDWLPLVTVFFSYEIMYSFVGMISKNSLQMGPYDLEMRLFGQAPSLLLQQTLRSPVLDYAGGFFYLTYFFVPLAFAFVLWKEDLKQYWNYTIAFGVCAYSGLITFLFYPVAPPWIQIPAVTRILTGSLDVNLGIPVYKTLFDSLSPNLYAAFPSMHSALPWLVFLFAFKTWKWKTLPLLIIPVGTWFSAVYLGEHYVVDVLGGIAYATVSFVAVEKISPRLSEKIGRLRNALGKWSTSKESPAIKTRYLETFVR